MTVSIEDQIKEVAREIALRRNVYRGWVKTGRLTQEASDKQIGAMEAVMETLKQRAGTLGDAEKAAFEDRELLGTGYVWKHDDGHAQRIPPEQLWLLIK